MGAVVFLGPSLRLEEARALFDAEYLPPAAAADICRVLAQGADAIGIIDGVFEQVASVRHKEVLYALAQGIPVYGASSMGALRAAETAAFGMIGVGRIFEAFARGEYEDDDEVAILHGAAEHAFRPLSEAMVNVRWGLELAEAAGVIGAPTRARLTALAKAAFYADRSWPALLRDGRGRGVPSGELAALEAFIHATRPDLKRDDARALLARMRADRAAGWPRPAADFDFHGTREFRAQLLEPARRERFLGRAVGDGVAPAALARYVRVWGSATRSELRSALLLRRLSKREQVDDPFTYSARSRELKSKVEAMGLDPGDWAAALGVAEVELDEYLTGARTHMADEFLPLAAVHDEQVRACRDALAERERTLAARGVERRTPAAAGVDETELLGWYAARRGESAPMTALDWVQQLGLEDAESFLAEVVSQYVYEHGPRP